MNIDNVTRKIIESATEMPEGNNRFLTIHKMIVDVYNKGRRSGHAKAVKICRNALDGLESANSATY